MEPASAVAPPRPAMPFIELVAMIASLTALNALAIDMMLPALASIGTDLGVSDPNDPQLVILVYLFSSGVAQLFYGPLADRFGRRPVLLGALAFYAVAAALSVVATGFAFLLATRMLQGVTTAAGRVVGVAVVRDMYAGRRMAEVMSLAMTVFMIAPILAPGLGQLFLTAGEWRGLFALLAAFGVVMVVWVALRLPETLAPEKRTPLSPASVTRAFGEVVSHRVPLGYMIASLLMFAAPMAYLSSADQIFSETFGLGELFPIAFGAVALSLAAASIANASLVGRYGMRLISHSATCLFVVACLAHLVVVLVGLESLPVFMGLQMIAFFGVGLMLSNFTSIALEPMGHVAGVASSALGFATMCGSALLGGFIARHYDGTTTPLVIGFAACSVATLAVVAITEKGRLFGVRPRAGTAAE